MTRSAWGAGLATIAANGSNATKAAGLFPARRSRNNTRARKASNDAVRLIPAAKLAMELNHVCPGNSSDKSISKTACSNGLAANVPAIA